MINPPPAKVPDKLTRSHLLVARGYEMPDNLHVFPNTRFASFSHQRPGGFFQSRTGIITNDTQSWILTTSAQLIDT
jgi:hypothetical protein